MCIVASKGKKQNSTIDVKTSKRQTLETRFPPNDLTTLHQNVKTRTRAYMNFKKPMIGCKVVWNIKKHSLKNSQKSSAKGYSLAQLLYNNKQMRSWLNYHTFINNYRPPRLKEGVTTRTHHRCGPEL